MQLMTMLLLKRNRMALRRDVIFAATADEEIDSDVGADWLVTRHPDLVRAEYGLSEMGGYTLYLEGRKFYPIMCAEKGTCWLKIRARASRAMDRCLMPIMPCCIWRAQLIVSCRTRSRSI